MARGGKRAGAGRKVGPANKRTREIAEQAVAEGITPLEVMIQPMRAHLAQGQLDKAAAVAKDAAPYMHPRLNAVAHGGGMSITHRPVDAPPKETREEWLARRRREQQLAAGGLGGVRNNRDSCGDGRPGSSRSCTV
jgi:hypothetical protein